MSRKFFNITLFFFGILVPESFFSFSAHCLFGLLGLKSCMGIGFSLGVDLVKQNSDLESVETKDNCENC